MVQLYDKDTGALLGSISEEQLEFLVDQLEEESIQDQDYYINSATLESFQENGADESLLRVLRQALGTREEMEIRWTRTITESEMPEKEPEEGAEELRPKFQLVKVWARFLRRSDGEPLSGGQYSVKLYDEDVLIDDKLGESRLDDHGRVQLLFDLADVSSSDFDLRPDLYLIVFDGEREIYRSPVRWNIDFLQRDPVTNQRDQLTQDLGTFDVAST